MSRLAIPTVEQSPAASQPLLAAVNQQLGMVPNLMKLVGNSPAALEAYLSLSGALTKGSLNAQMRERIALTIAEYNGCDYCLAAHAYLCKNLAKLSDADIDAARSAHATDAKTNAALQFARQVAEQRGRVSDAELSSLRAAGFDDAAVIEIVLNVALNVLTNYVNNVARTDVDFPKVNPR
ncbi:carboxymuconolactone decarboxylase family protein [Undibacterium sp. Ji50W]|uniref:carboxymuconolactone decarboxylase family protein n=1 Tax=Undibacterium sp. Ji50W TaxID=3413041 RepID=UPI003BF41ADD